MKNINHNSNTNEGRSYVFEKNYPLIEFFTPWPELQSESTTEAQNLVHDCLINSIEKVKPKDYAEKFWQHQVGKNRTARQVADRYKMNKFTAQGCLSKEKTKKKNC